MILDGLQTCQRILVWGTEHGEELMNLVNANLYKESILIIVEGTRSERGSLFEISGDRLYCCARGWPPAEEALPHGLAGLAACSCLEGRLYETFLPSELGHRSRTASFGA
jgi:hypothetical protein